MARNAAWVQNCTGLETRGKDRSGRVEARRNAWSRAEKVGGANLMSAYLRPYPFWPELAGPAGRSVLDRGVRHEGGLATV